MFSGLKIVAKGANSRGIDNSMPGFQGPNPASDWEAFSTNFKALFDGLQTRADHCTLRHGFQADAPGRDGFPRRQSWAEFIGH